MKLFGPLVTIGIPTYNRANLLGRAIQSALNQDYAPIEIVISDNASSDGADLVCSEFAAKYDSVKWVRQSSNVGPTANFHCVLRMARGEYFMWLGDDDWIDSSYVSQCMAILISDPEMSLVSGSPKYYRSGQFVYDGKLQNLMERSWMHRVIKYYANVADNGVFHGVMRTAQLRAITIQNAMGCDWHLVASVVACGKSEMISAISVHRELGGATTSYRKIAESLGLPRIQAIFPMITIALGAAKNILSSGLIYKKRGIPARLILGGIVFVVICMRAVRAHLGNMWQVSKRQLLSIRKKK